MGAPADPRHLLILAHQDADGLASGAVAGAFLRARIPGAKRTYRAVDYDLVEGWAHLWKDIVAGKSPFHPIKGLPVDGLAIVDFLPTTVPAGNYLLYADHHEATFRETPSLLAAYNRRTVRNQPVFYDAASVSCVSLLVRGLRRAVGWEPPETLIELVQLAHRCDHLASVTPADVFDLDHSRLARLNTMLPFVPRADWGGVMDRLANGETLDDALFSAFPAALEQARTALRLSRESLVERRRWIGDDAVLLDWRGAEGTPVPFVEFSQDEPQYSLRLWIEPTALGFIAHAALGRSPWVRRPPAGWCHPHMGRIAETMGGGGHAYAARFRIAATTSEEAEERAGIAIRAVEPFMRHLELGHPFADLPTVIGRRRV